MNSMVERLKQKHAVTAALPESSSSSSGFYAFYKTLNVVSALLACFSLAMLTCDKFRPTQSGLISASEGLLCSSALVSVMSVMTATMPLFKFEGQKLATRTDLVIA
ncbi:hypothetical protein GGP41_001599 [Bipolaris sorokiniana]|uniref:Uncharacterized protein n=1 Tax=Cochliobolus sativus TaxID=45130 RepID=A0A8H5ZRT7_COCSA|nr:hypothetical protein GGP41_001599 [Bipolaris sorokiniana]